MNRERITKAMSSIILIIALILGTVLFNNRYPLIFKDISKINFYGRVYLDHFVASFLIPILIFVLLGGIILLFYGKVKSKEQEKLILFAIYTTLAIIFVWEILIPLFLLIKSLITNNTGILILFKSLYYWYISPRNNLAQVMFDIGGLFLFVAFTKFLRPSLLKRGFSIR